MKPSTSIVFAFVFFLASAVSTYPKPVETLAPVTDSGAATVMTGGFASFFPQNGVPGACGVIHQDSDLIGAIDIARYGNAGTESSLCFHQVKITNTNNGKSVNISIADACISCPNSNSFDLSTGAFLKIASLSDGIVPIDWVFV